MSRTMLFALFAFAALPLSAHAADQSAVGDWSGALHHGDAAFRVRFHVQATADGKLTGTVSGLPGDDATPTPAWVEKSGEELVIGVAGGRWSGIWDQSRAAWVGSWTQADLSVPLALRWDGDGPVRMLRSKPAVVPQIQALPPITSGGGGALIVPPSAR